MPTGQSDRNKYIPGQPRPRPPVAPEGTYQMKLVSKGLEGDKGWKTKPGKFPCRHCKFELIGVEDESGKPWTVMFYASASPNSFFNIWDLATAAGYPEELDLPRPTRPNDTALVAEVCEGIDRVLDYVIDNDITINGEVTHEAYRGGTSARLTILPPEGTEPEDVEEQEIEEEEPEPVKPAPKKVVKVPAKKVAGKR